MSLSDLLEMFLQRLRDCTQCSHYHRNNLTCHNLRSSLAKSWYFCTFSFSFASTLLLLLLLNIIIIIIIIIIIFIIIIIIITKLSYLHFAWANSSEDLDELKLICSGTNNYDYGTYWPKNIFQFQSNEDDSLENRLQVWACE